MEAVVAEGTGKPAEIDGYTIAGKTGTAKRIVNRRYSDTEYNASFVGFVPSRKPVYTVVVVTESPHGPNGYYGGPVSAPVFRRISEALMRYGGVPPTFNAPPPVLIQRQPDSGREVPASGPAAPPVVLPPGTGDGLFPDVAGLNPRDALMTLARLGVTPKLRGTGVVVVDQRPAAGTPIENGAVVTLWLARQPQSLRAEATIAQ
jgi:membrane peptidoglycan carboxypeptidase